MSPKALKGRTLILAGLAGCSLLGLLLAMMGLGTSVPRSRNASIERTELPSLPAGDGNERLDEPEAYADITAHPVFVADRLPRAFLLVPDAKVGSTTDDVKLTGVLITPTLRMATLQTTGGGSLRLRQQGPEVEGWHLISLEPRAALVSGPGGTRRLELQTYAGGHNPLSPVPLANRSVSTAMPTIAQVSPSPKPLPRTNPSLREHPLTPQEQIEAVRRSIEARRRELEQSQSARPNKSTP